MNVRLIALVALLGLITLPTLAQTIVIDEVAVGDVVVLQPVRPGGEVLAVPAQPAAPAEAQGDAGEEADTEPVPATPASKPAKPGVLQFHLMDGTIITGKLTTQALPVSTEFGELTVPIQSIASFAPGLASHSEIDQAITTLINNLASPDAKKRDKAQAQLLTYGPALLPELQAYANDPDAERKVRIATIMEELQAVEPDEFDIEHGPSVSLIRLDQIVTKQFTIAGKIKQDTFTIASKFGELTVKLGDIKAVERMSSEKPEMRRTVQVAGTDMTCKGYKKTGIRVNRGDRIIITAEGNITMSPWGSNSVSGPNGIAQNGMYNGKIPMGALAGRIGDSGEEMLIGSKKSFIAKKSGVLQLGFAMQQNWANYQFPGEYKTRVRVVPAQ